MITFRVVLFTLLVAAVVVAGYLFVRWYATISQRRTVTEGDKIGSVSR